MNAEEEDFLNAFQEEILEGIIDILVIQSATSNEFTNARARPPFSGSLLASMSDNDNYWLFVLHCIIKKVPEYAINTIIDIIMDIPIPTVETVNTMFEEDYELTAERAANPLYDHQVERNICIVLSCLAHKLAGMQSNQIFTQNVCNYLFQFLISGHKSTQVVIAFLTLEKFAVTRDNKTIIENAMAEMKTHPLLDLLEYADSDDNVSRQIGFCARWALDNTFPVPGRVASYESVDMSRINVILKQSIETFMKLSPDGLEVRCDAYYFGSMRATCEVGHGSWYYEVTLITGGAMRIGLATAATAMNDTYALGRDDTSVGYDGSTRMLWTKGCSRYTHGIAFWKAGDVVGVFINTISKRMYLLQNEDTVVVNLPEFFDDPSGTKKFYPALTIAPYEQCRFNFGAEDFKYTVPEEGPHPSFNEVGQLTPEQKMVKPKCVLQSESSKFNDDNNACEICFDNAANVKLLPCGHNTFCGDCASKIELCPICRVEIAKRV